ncbi:MAG: YbaB/EbfC family nucleoid-associated protein [Alphaproteobacteria bacterium]|nr:YbaB/EbfC family nucleoid-associated protein [Alphaproteobacteria bacterium]
MKNFGEILKKAQEMQKKVNEMQEALANAEVEGVAGGSMVKVLMSGDGRVKKISIDKSLAGDTDMLEDLLLVAFNDGKSKAEEIANKQADDMKSGLNLPFKLPF